MDHKKFGGLSNLRASNHYLNGLKTRPALTTSLNLLNCDNWLTLQGFHCSDSNKFALWKN